MKWYRKRMPEWEKAVPVISVCGDDCGVCPRYLARTGEELHETAVFWYKAGRRDHAVSNEEIGAHLWLKMKSGSGTWRRRRHEKTDVGYGLGMRKG